MSSSEVMTINNLKEFKDKEMTTLDVARITGKEHKSVIRDVNNLIKKDSNLDKYFNESTYKGKRRMEKCLCLTEQGLKILLSSYRGITQEQVESCGIKDLNVIHTYTRFETSFINMLDEALKEIDIEGITQYSIDEGKYRIDYYIPSLKLVIEYDEEQHNNLVNMRLDEEREDYIIDKLGCKFIRCDYKDSDIKNVMKVLKFIMFKYNIQSIK